MGNEQSTQKKRQKPNAVDKKVQNGEMNGHAVPPPGSPEPVASKEAVVQQKCEIPPETDVKSPKPSAGKEEVDSKKANKPAHVETTHENETTAATDTEPQKEAQQLVEKEVTNIFGKMFKKKIEPVKSDAVDGQVKVLDLKIDLQPDSVDIKRSTEPEPEPEDTSLESLLVEVAEEIDPSEEVKEAEKTVMNFFKTFVSPTKTSKEAKATPDASKDQPQKETPPAPSTNEAPKAPPPPPPAPPKMENKVEPVVKKEETLAAAAAKAADSSTKTKPKDSPFSKLFRSKPVVVEEKKPVEVQQVDASKTSTLEAAAKPEEPPAPKPEEKKKEKKSFGMFKPKVLLGQLSTRIQAAASSAAASVTLVAAGSAPEPKKETPAAPAVVEVAPAVKAKEEPKPATPAPPVAPDNKSVASSDNASPNIPRKLEKRNSLNLFFKNLGQKRHSDAGVQTDPVAPEKAK
ncbi:breast carcinoma-amplified sequence 1 isoform X2 [Xyrauchen texanus]|uniref:breast carcinoma-amplified sequence 1 isoform X2 n=1 Tax=Xyrauchen texanus TaxID=154827 RepID=UPI00224292AD|nr:breast carcinoma-amplified sequence 1 isoform X2 [Xyrauchen texanus]